jgi:hypothetical protein
MPRHNMKQYITLTDLYLTFLTPQDSYMQKVPKGSILHVVDGNLCYESKSSIDNEVSLLYHKFIRETTQEDMLS